jgi:hypothetical protein
MLCDEFHFESLSERLSAFRQSADFKTFVMMEDSEARQRLSGLEERLLQRDHDIAMLRQTQKSISAALMDAIVRQNARIEALEKWFEERSQHFQTQEASLETAIVRLSRIETQFADTQSVSASKATATPEPIPARNLTPALGSVIISDFPEIFADFGGKQFSLLWRGGRDGFGVRDFHDRCDGHANTLTLIEDTNGNIFGGFTPLKCESCLKWKADASLKSFLFTLKNPRNIPARKFALKAEKKEKAIYCDSKLGPCFNDIIISDNCNANTNSVISFGFSYTNDTGLDGRTFFTGSRYFRVNEIEVFAIMD